MNIDNLNILFVVHDDKANGSTQSLYTLIEGLNVVSDIDSNVICRTKGESYRLFTNNGIKAKVIRHAMNYNRISKKRNKIHYIIRDIYSFVSILKICIYIKVNRINIVCCNSSVTDVGARAARILKIPYIFYMREFMEEDFFIEYTNRKRMRKLLENAKAVIFISEAIEKKFCNIYNLKNIARFANGFIVEKYINEQKKIFLEEKIKIVQVGVLSEGKGTRDSVNMINTMVCSGITKIHLTLVGRGKKEYEEEINEFIHKNRLEKYITLLGWSSNIQKILEEQDILLMNSISEGFGRVTIEGMLAGLLIIGRNTGGTKEIVSNKETGMLFNSEKEFVDIIKKIYVEPEKYRTVAKTGQKYAKDNYSHINTAHRFIEVIQNI